MTSVNYGFHAAELYFTGETDKQLKILRKNIARYGSLIESFHANLVTPADEKAYASIMSRPGTVPYLAMASHSLSHTQFWPEVEAEIRKAFSSGVNPGYKKK